MVLISYRYRLEGGWGAVPYFEDSIAIGAFHAMKKGVLTSNSAGNSGPSAESISNVSPWSLSVAANTLDRKFIANVQLGNGQTFEGGAINTFQLNNAQYPLVWSGNIPSNGSSSLDSRYCEGVALNSTAANGTILLCDEVGEGVDPNEVGAVGTIMTSNKKDVTFTYVYPASTLNDTDNTEVLHYINTTSNPTATIQRSTEIKDKSAPFVASFSSRGPNSITPDLTAPRVDVLAAWSEATTLTGDEGDSRVVPYNIISGTSMSRPHATGAAAYVKSFHPNWYPAAIKSALMTTGKLSETISLIIFPEAEFAYGAGQINPIKAINPGLCQFLVSIMSIERQGQGSRRGRLCQFLVRTRMRYKQFETVIGDNNACLKNNLTTVWDLNYSAYTIYDEVSGSTSRAFHRTVTNVGSPVSIYKAIVTTADSSQLNMKVHPEVLWFTTHVGQKLTFKVTVGLSWNVGLFEEMLFSGNIGLSWN